MEAIKKLNYQPNQIARIMKGKRANILGVLIPDFANPFYTDFLKQLEVIATSLGYRLLIASNAVGSSQIENVQYLMSRNVDAVIICSYSENRDALEYIMQNSIHIPTVFLDKLEGKEAVHSVYVDGFLGIKNIVEYLIQLGHKKIAMIKGASGYQIANDRFLGYQVALKEYGISMNENFVWEGDYSLQSGAMAAAHFLSLDERPTAIVSSSDYMAIGAINYLMQQGYKVPEDFSVTGHDGIIMGELLKPKLTTAKIPIKEMAQTAVKILIDELENDIKEKSTVVYVGDILIRESTIACTN